MQGVGGLQQEQLVVLKELGQIDVEKVPQTLLRVDALGDVYLSAVDD